MSDTEWERRRATKHTLYRKEMSTEYIYEDELSLQELEKVEIGILGWKDELEKRLDSCEVQKKFEKKVIEEIDVYDKILNKLRMKNHRLQLDRYWKMGVWSES